LRAVHFEHLTLRRAFVGANSRERRRGDENPSCAARACAAGNPQRQVKSSGLQNSETIGTPPPNVAPDAAPTLGATEEDSKSNRPVVSKRESSNPPDSAVDAPSCDPDRWPMKIGPLSNGDRLGLAASVNSSNADASLLDDVDAASVKNGGSGNSDSSGGADIVDDVRVKLPGSPRLETVGCPGLGGAESDGWAVALVAAPLQRLR
jgi:hypothetical protein